MEFKKDFPTYPKNGIYFDSFTRGLEPYTSIKQQISYLKSNGRISQKGLYRTQRNNSALIQDTKDLVKAHFNMLDYGISFQPNLDFTLNIVLDSLISNSNSKLVFYTTIYEDNSILAPLIHRFSSGKISLYLSKSKTNEEITNDLTMKSDQLDWIVLSGISPILSIKREIKTLSRDHHGKLIVDYSKIAGQSNIDVSSDKVEIALFETSSDLLGPAQLTILGYKSPNIFDKPAISGSSAIQNITNKQIVPIKSGSGLEIGTMNIQAIIGLQSTLEYLRRIGIGRIQSQQRDLNQYLSSHLKNIEPINIISIPHENTFASVINFYFDGIDSNDVAILLDETYSIEVRSGIICSHLAMEELEIENLIQVSTHIYTEKSDIDVFIHALKEIVQSFT